MTPTAPALLPPDPTKDAHYWVKHVEFGAIPVRWDAAGQFWENGFDASHMGRLGCTIASPHPIPGPAALEALHNPTKAMIDVVLSGLALNARIPDIIAAMLRAALETKEAPDAV